jgi:hypothetical protein
MKAHNYAKEPWKHPAVWSGHVVRMAREVSAGVDVTVAACECGWCVCALTYTHRGAGLVAQDDAITDHWHSVIAEAESVAA